MRPSSAKPTRGRSGLGARILVGLLALSLLGCGWARRHAPSFFGVTRGEWERIDAWLGCEHCSDGQLQAVLDIGPRAKHVLSVTVWGLSPDRVQVFRSRAGAAWEDAQGTWPDRRAFERHHLANLQARTQVRSGVALAGLGEADPIRAVLDSAAALGIRADVVEVFQEILSSHPSVDRYRDGIAAGRVMDVGPEPTPPFVPGPEWVQVGSGSSLPLLNSESLGAGGPGVGLQVIHSQVTPVRGLPMVLRRCVRAPPASRDVPASGPCRSYDSTPPDTTLTGLQGYFRFDSLPEGVYEVQPDTAGRGYTEVTPGPMPLIYLLVGKGDSLSFRFDVRH